MICSADAIFLFHLSSHNLLCGLNFYSYSLNLFHGLNFCSLRKFDLLCGCYIFVPSFLAIICSGNQTFIPHVVLICSAAKIFGPSVDVICSADAIFLFHLF
jgi:hypothetical protein